jgi:TrmH family RNA methyltransferase
MITSSQNSKIKKVRMLLTRSRERKDSGVFIVEGVRLAEEALRSGWVPQLVLYSEGLSERGKKVVSEFVRGGIPAEEVSSDIINNLGNTETSQGLLILLKQQDYSLPASPGLIFIPSEIRDPGNLGTMFRTAAAAGVDVVLVPPDTVDIYAPKVLRAAMGAHFRIPIISLSWEEIRDYIGRITGMHVYGAEVLGEIIYTKADFSLPTTLIVGGEAFGVGEHAKIIPQECVYIPMCAEVESLNAATASAVLLFEVVRQRSSMP